MADKDIEKQNSPNNNDENQSSDNALKHPNVTPQDQAGASDQDERHLANIHQGKFVNQPGAPSPEGGAASGLPSEDEGNQKPATSEDKNLDASKANAPADDSGNIAPSTTPSTASQAGPEAAEGAVAAGILPPTQTGDAAAPTAGTAGGGAAQPSAASAPAGDGVQNAAAGELGVNPIDEIVEAQTAASTQGVLDTPVLNIAGDLSGAEDQAVALGISVLVGNADSASVQIAGLPEGATLSAGNEGAGGVWTLTPAQLAGLSLVPPEDFSGAINLQVSLTTQNAAQSSTVSQVLALNLTPVADVPTVSAVSVSGAEDLPIGLSLSAALADIDGSERLNVVISGLPEGAALSQGEDLGGGSWQLTPAQLTAVNLTPPENFSGALSLRVTAIASEADTTASSSADFTVNIAGVANTPIITVSNVTGVEDIAIGLDISAALTGGENEALSLTISNVPSGATLSAGTNEGNGTWSLTPAQLENLTITPPANFSGSLNLTVTATATEGADQASSTQTLNVAVTGVADTPSLTVTDVTGTEDIAIGLEIQSALTGGENEALSLTISSVPDGAILSAGTENPDGTWSLTPDQLDGLTLTPPENFSGDFDLSVTATVTEGGDTASATQDFTVSISGVADTPTLAAGDVSGLEDNAINLDLSSALTDTDGSETLSVTISNIPDGVTLSAGMDNGDGSWTLDPGDLSGLQISFPEDYSGSADLTVTALATEEGTEASISDVFSVNVDPVADTPNLMVGNSTGIEGQAIDLSISSGLTDLDGSESLSISISGVPDGATLSSGEDQGDGTWILGTDDLQGLTITPSVGSEGTFDLTVTATSTEAGNQDQASISDTIHLTVQDDGNIYGTEGNDTIRGTVADDTIYGYGGNDNIRADEGADTVYGGTGDDTIRGEGGDDVLYGGEGHDVIRGGEGDDTIIGGQGDDNLRGEAGSDIFVFGLNSGQDSVDGGKGGGWTDTIRLEDVNGPPGEAPSDPSGWTLDVKGKATYTVDEANNVLEFDQEASGTITLSDGSELDFKNIEKIEW